MTGPRRHPAVTILAIIQLLSALVYGLFFAALVLAGDQILGVLGDGILGSAAVGLSLLAAGIGLLAAASLVAGLLLLRRRQLGWTLTMLLTGFGLASSILTWSTNGSVLAVQLLVQVVTVFYLNQSDVRTAFGISGRAGAERPEASRG